MSNTMLVRRQVKIGPEFSFWTSLNSVATEQKACVYYEANLQRFLKDASFIKSDVIVVLDTNVLLYLYTLPVSNRDGILKYITSNKDKVFIPGQVVSEYLKHREGYITSAQETLKSLVGNLETAITDLTVTGRKTLFNKLENFKQQAIIKNEMPVVIEKIDAWWKSAGESLDKADKAKEEILNELKTKVAEAEKAISSLTKDKVLETVLCAKNLEPLTDDEKTYLQNLYGRLLHQFDEYNRNVRYSFPGCGDKKKLESGFDPCGDFYIYHEILALMKEMDCDAMFITKDVKKSDWVQPDRRPFMHYLFDEYAHTGHMINIVGVEAIPMEITPIIPVKEDPHEGEIEEKVEIKVDEEPLEAPVAEAVEPKEAVKVRRGKEISEDQFITELEICIDWAMNYGGGYVKEEFFLRNILAVRKHYDYDYSREILQKLIKKKLVKSEDEEHDGETFKCLVWGEKHKEK